MPLIKLCYRSNCNIAFAKKAYCVLVECPIRGNVFLIVSTFSENGMSGEGREAPRTLYFNPARSYSMLYGVCENANLGNCRLQGWRRQKEQLSIQKLGRGQLSTSYIQVGEIDTILLSCRLPYFLNHGLTIKTPKQNVVI
jgi:hypothetical protein